MLSSEKEFTAEKTLFQFDFGLASGLLFFLNGFTECSCTMTWPLIRKLSRMMCNRQIKAGIHEVIWDDS